MKTYTPAPDPAVLDRLRAYAPRLADDPPQAEPAKWAGAYLHGLPTDGDRERVEPPSRRVARPAGLAGADPERALQPFVSRSPWDHQAVPRRYPALLAETSADPDGVFVIDDTTPPKRGRHSVGVRRQRCGAVGEKANCQAVVSGRYVARRGHYPLALRLFPPGSWVADAARLDRAGVPAEFRRERTTGQTARDPLDRARSGGLPGRVAPAAAGHGASAAFRRALADRGLYYPAGVTDEAVVLTARPTRGRPARRAGVGPAGGRPPTNHRLPAGSPRPVRLRELAARVPLRRVAGPAGRFARVRVWPGHGWKRGRCAGADPAWVPAEAPPDGGVKYALSNRPAGTALRRAVGPWERRRPVGRGCRQVRGGLGLDHFEGRSWRGLHHHAAVVMVAHGFPLLGRDRVRGEGERAADRPGPRRRGGPTGR